MALRDGKEGFLRLPQAIRGREEAVTGSSGDFWGDFREPQMKETSVTCQRSPSSIQVNPHQHKRLRNLPKDRRA